MKSFKTIVLVLSFLLMLPITTHAQEEKKKSFNEIVTQNPNAEEDLKAMSAYIDALIDNKLDLAASFLSDDYVQSGPANGETSTKTQNLEDWKEAHTVRTNQKNEYTFNTWRVLDGDYEGDWVSVWGTYTYTQDEKEISLPYQYTANLDKGKIKKAVIYYDNLSVVKALGYTIESPKKE
jgi:ketosteroid isomerase-like protein